MSAAIHSRMTEPMTAVARLPSVPTGTHPKSEKEPAAQYAADKPDDQVDEESRAASLDDQVGDPPGRQAEEQIP